MKEAFFREMLSRRLEKYCEENGARFQAVDLRWGVNEESQLNQKTLQICFNEIARCQKISPKPNFIILLGEKYGWQPIPEIIPEDEMVQILRLLQGDDKSLIGKWYRLDENAVPPVYVLQPRKDDQKDYNLWEPIEKELSNILRNIIRNSSDKLNFSPEQKIRYFASATHQEIIRGALNVPEGIENPEKHVFAISRTITGLPFDESAKGFIDLVDNHFDKPGKDAIDELKTTLKRKAWQ